MRKRSPTKKQNLIEVEPIEPVIRVIRRQRVILDSDLALIYDVATKRLDEQVKRNRQRFPSDFIFPLTADEAKSVRGTRKHRDPRYLPYAFTEHGAIIAANVLNSERAVAMSVRLRGARLCETPRGTGEYRRTGEEIG